MTEPAGNSGPTANIASATCTALSCVMSSTGTSDPEGHTIRATRGTGVTARRSPPALRRHTSTPLLAPTRSP
jgi:hypothetical protein